MVKPEVGGGEGRTQRTARTRGTPASSSHSCNSTRGLGPGYETETNYLRLYLAQLRRKLESDPSQPKHLITEPGMGYRLER